MSLSAVLKMTRVKDDKMVMVIEKEIRMSLSVVMDIVKQTIRMRQIMIPVRKLHI